MLNEPTKSLAHVLHDDVKGKRELAANIDFVRNVAVYAILNAMKSLIPFFGPAEVLTLVSPIRSVMKTL